MREVLKTVMLAFMLMAVLSVSVTDEVSAGSSLELDSVSYEGDLLYFSGSAEPGKVITLWASQGGQRVSPYMDVQPAADGAFSKTVRIALDRGQYELNARQSGDTVSVPLTSGISVDYAVYDGKVLRFCGTAEPGKVVSSWVSDFSGNKVSTVMDIVAGSDGAFCRSVKLQLPSGSMVLNASQSEVTCTEGIDRIAQPTVSIDRESISIDAENTLALSASHTLGGCASIVWTSLTPEVCSVDLNGNVAAVSAGSGEVGVYLFFGEEKVASATCAVKVDYLPAQVSAETTFQEGKSIEARATVPEGMSLAEVVWTSSDLALEIVSDGADATISSYKPGKYTLTVTIGDLYKTELEIQVTKKSPVPGGGGSDGGSGGGSGGGTGGGSDVKPDKPGGPTVDKHINPDGSVTITTTIKEKDPAGNDLLVKDEVTEKDGSTISKRTETVTDPDGNEIGNKVVETVRDSDGGTKITTNSTSKGADGMVTTEESESELNSLGYGSTESRVTVSGNGLLTVTEKSSETSAEGSTEAVKVITEKDGSRTETVITEKKDGKGKTISRESESSSEERFTESNGTTGVLKTESQEKENADGSVEGTHTASAESSDGLRTDAVCRTGTDGSVSIMISSSFESDGDVDGNMAVSVSEQSALVSSRLPSGDAAKSVDIKLISGTSVRFLPDAVSLLYSYGASVKVSGDGWSVDSDAETVRELTDGDNGSVVLSLKSNDPESLNKTQASVVGDRHFIDLGAYVGENKVHQLGGTATVSFDYGLKDGEEEEKLVVYYVDDNGNKTLVESAYGNGKVTIRTTHFSVFMVAYEGEEEVPVPVDEDDSTALYIGAAVAALVVIVAVVFLIIRNRA